MAEKTIFGKIASGEVPVDLLIETDRVIAFHDMSPQAPVHVLVIPKVTDYTNVTELAVADPELLAEMVAVAKRIADDLGDGEFRLLFNNGASVGQTVFHVHAHVLIGQLKEQNLVEP